MTRFLLAALALMYGLSACAGEGSAILIVRHGEKPAMGLGQLTCRGLNRALALAPLILNRYGTPTAIYAPNPAVLKKERGGNYAYIRPLATIEPLAVRSGLPVDLGFGMTQVDALADKLLDHPAGLQVVAWEHHFAEALARRLMARLGADPGRVPEWADSDYDSIDVIRISAGADARPRVVFSHEQEGLDGLPESCPDIAAGTFPAARHIPPD